MRPVSEKIGLWEENRAVETRAGKNLRFFKKVFTFLGFLGFLGF